ncbi:MAG: hypothetical protein M1834_005335 [Cirrosporium novae-zelandiae]|nr:MAG: hypothetical protein M1834_005335 [Cirrosporium novae-zelandiae]
MAVVGNTHEAITPLGYEGGFSKLEKLRPLGRLERFSTTRSRLGVYHNVGLTGFYSYNPSSSSSTSPSLPSSYLLRSLIFHALSTLVAQHPSLSTIPIDDGVPERDAYFVRLPEIDFNTAVTFIESKNIRTGDENGSDVELDKLLEAQHNQSFEGQQIPGLPVWRLIILTNPASQSSFIASFVFHHAIADTGSAMAFHKCFAIALSNVSSEDAAKTLPRNAIIQAFDTEMLPSLEQLYELSVSNEFLERERFLTEHPDVPAHVWSGDVAQLPVATRFESLKITKDDARRFVAACRKNDTTVTATLQALVASVLFDLIPEEFTTLNSICPVALRRWLPAPIDEFSMGTWVGIIGETYQRQQGFSWKEACRCRKNIQEVVARKGKDMVSSFPRSIVDFNHYFMDQMGKKRGCSFEISNIGILKMRPEDSWRIGRLVFSQCASATSGIKVSVATGGDGSLNIGFTWPRGVFDEGLMRAFINRFSAVLLELATPAK